MRAAGRGEGWEACVAALLRSAAVFVNDSPFLRHGVGAGGVGARLFASGASEETKSRSRTPRPRLERSSARAPPPLCATKP
jgi:hypothetical protein